MKDIKDLWDKAEILAKVIASIVIPILIFVYGNKINATLKEKEIGVKYIEIATNILTQQPKNTPVSIRKWAIEVLNVYSEKVPFSQEVINELHEKPLLNHKYATTESGQVITDEAGNPLTIE